jgi:hypothetical protein
MNNLPDDKREDFQADLAGYELPHFFSKHAHAKRQEDAPPIVHAEPDENSIAGVAETGLNEIKNAFRLRREQENKRFLDATDTEYWICLCFQSREQKEEFVEKTGWCQRDEKYLNGVKVARKLGLTLAEIKSNFVLAKPDTMMSDIAMEDSFYGQIDEDLEGREKG